MWLEREAHILGRLASSSDGSRHALRNLEFFNIPRDSGDVIVLLLGHPALRLLGRYLPPTKINDLLLPDLSRTGFARWRWGFDIMDLASFLEFAIQATHRIRAFSPLHTPKPTGRCPNATRPLRCRTVSRLLTYTRSLAPNRTSDGVVGSTQVWSLSGASDRHAQHIVRLLPSPHLRSRRKPPPSRLGSPAILFALWPTPSTPVDVTTIESRVYMHRTIETIRDAETTLVKLLAKSKGKEA
ncbi:hypothetical protein R3P38DRAFT_2787355 [Favolaschia claudopus]|uniref:Uncharacterized protein n=1 Tax=Favolaschia claudopus TaxID=2862362 RepID=A0AAW0ANM5_9AGAR